MLDFSPRLQNLSTRDNSRRASNFSPTQIKSKVALDFNMLEVLEAFPKRLESANTIVQGGWKRKQLEFHRELKPYTSAARQKELNGILSSTHFNAIAEVCARHNYTLSIRETGSLSIKRIKEGAKAKPHSILEKSIKIASLKGGYGEEAQNILTKLQGLDLDGFVGHWDQNGKLIGVRVDEELGKQIMGIESFVVSGNHHSKGYYVPLDLDSENGLDKLNKFKGAGGSASGNWKTCLYTGDYDMHEVYKDNKQIQEASAQKVTLLNRLNASIATVDSIRQGKAVLTGNRIHLQAGSSYAMFQHGDQATYAMNQRLEANRPKLFVDPDYERWKKTNRQQWLYKPAKLVEAVSSETDEPLAWCHRGEWYVTLNRKEHDALRKILNVTKPHSWSEKQYTRRRADEVKMEYYK